MNISQIESFLALANILNFTKAAAELFISQPTLSRNITLLEETLGFQLFHRNKQYVHLTSKGSAFLPYAQKIADSHTAAYEFAASMRASKKIQREVRIGISTFLFQKFFPLYKNHMHKLYPDAYFSICDGLHKDLINQLHSGDLDILFTSHQHLTQHKNIESLFLLRVPMQLVVSNQNKLAHHKGIISLDAIYNSPLPFLTIDTIMQEQLKAFFPHKKIQLVRSINRCFSIIEANLGIAIFQKGTQNLSPPDSVCFLSVENDPFYMDAMVSWLKSSETSPWWASFLQETSLFIHQYTSHKQSINLLDFKT